MPKAVFGCGNPNCAETIDAVGLNKVQIEALRRWPKTCRNCGKQTKWIETSVLLDTDTIKKTKRTRRSQNDQNNNHIH